MRCCQRHPAIVVLLDFRGTFASVDDTALFNTFPQNDMAVMFLNTQQAMHLIAYARELLILFEMTSGASQWTIPSKVFKVWL